MLEGNNNGNISEVNDKNNNQDINQFPYKKIFLVK